MRNVPVDIIDMHNDIKPTHRTFVFNDVQDLDTNIDKFIIDVLKLRRVTVNIYNEDDNLSADEVAELEAMDYEIL